MSPAPVQSSMPEVLPAREAPAPQASPALEVLTNLFKRLNAAGIRYCHWKSNEHLTASMIGTTDVDVLFERRSAQRLTRLLTETPDFKRFVVKPGRGYPGIEDYVGFDSSTGKLTHLHVHYQLTLGEKFLKGHRLPWEEVYLTSRVLDKRYGVYVADPHIETVALLVRAVMKLRLRDVLLEALGRPYLGGGMLRELRWLAERVNEPRLIEVGSRLVGARAARLLPALIAGKRPSVQRLREFGHLADPDLSEYRLYGSAAAMRQMATRELSIIWWKAKNWYLGAATKSTRTLPQGGLFIAFLGADGAGKTTLTQQIAEWLSREVAVTQTYGGSGKGSASAPRRLLQALAGLRRRMAGRAAQAQAREPAAPRSRAPTLSRLVWVLALIRERRRRAAEARRARGRGMVVLSDRLPQRQFPGLNDGPRLTAWLDIPSGLRRAAATHEQRAYDLVELTPPDLVVKLHVSAAVAAQRKPETQPELLRSGIEVVRALQFPPTTRVLEVDADQPFEDVLLKVKQAIWECI